MEESATAVSYFNIFISGQLVSVAFPLGPEAGDIFCRYEFIAGPDWEHVSGLKSGITQTASNRNGNFNDCIVFNMPLELTYRSTNIYGWPQILVCIYGKTRWGIETSVGYSRIHVPVFTKNDNQLSRVPILKPRCSNTLSDVTTWLTGRNPELKDPRVLLDNSKNQGQLVSVAFPLGPEAGDIFCRYEFIAGPDWEHVSGLKSGITQTASNRNGNFNDCIVFNMPLELTYRSTNIYGWPQILVCIYGKTRWRIETSVGYSRIHVPVFTKNDNQLSRVPILKPRCSNTLSDVTTWLTGRNPELKDPRVLLDNSKNQGLSTESYGEILFVLNVMTRGATRLGLEC